MVWCRSLEPKHSFILWLVLLRKLLTLDRLESWGADVVDNRCVLCRVEEETIAHMFFGCVYSGQVLRSVLGWLGNVSVPVGHNYWRSWLGRGVCARGVRMELKVAAIAATIYALWQERNARRHHSIPKSESQVVMSVQRSIQGRFCHLRRGNIRAADERYIAQLVNL